MARNDLYFLSTVVLGCSRFGAEPMGGVLGASGKSCHEELCDVISGDWGGKSRLMTIMPRDHFKSTILRNYCIQRILQNPNVSILLLGATLTNQAMRSLGSIKHQFETNPVLKALFPDIRPQKGLWTGKKITVTRPYHGDEATIEVTAVGLEPESGHYDIIVPDDIVTEANSNSRDRQESVITWVTGIEPMLNPGGVIIGAGTRFADYDWYGFLMREAPEIWAFHVRSQVYDDEGNMSVNGNQDAILFPEEWDPRRVKEKQTAMGMQKWCCQYGNDPVPGALAEIKEEWVEASYAMVPDGLDVTNYGGFDPRGSGVCEAASAMVSIDREGTIWIRDVQGGLWDIHESLDKFLEDLEKWQPMHSVLEAIGVGSPLEQLLMEEMDHRKQYYSVEYIKSWDKNLDDMVRTVLIPRLQCGKIRIAPHLKGSPLEHQLLRFPKAARKDRLAATTMAVWIAAQYGHSQLAGEDSKAESEEEEVDYARSREKGFSRDTGRAPQENHAYSPV